MLIKHFPFCLFTSKIENSAAKIPFKQQQLSQISLDVTKRKPDIDFSDSSSLTFTVELWRSMRFRNFHHFLKTKTERSFGGEVYNLWRQQMIAHHRFADCVSLALYGHDKFNPKSF
jgi:hypothetical protein